WALPARVCCSPCSWRCAAGGSSEVWPRCASEADRAPPSCWNASDAGEGPPASRAVLMPAFRVEWGERGVAHLIMDDPQRRVNVLDEAAIADLETEVARLESEPRLEGVVLRSGKNASFIAGAD